jgi:hypothetical protein
MTTTYGVYHPKSGETFIVNTKEEAINLFYKFMIDFSKEFFHNTMYFTIQENEDGSVSYFNDGNEVDRFLSPREIEDLWSEASEIQDLLNKRAL